MTQKKRFVGLDVIRTLATLFVMTTHGFAYLGLMDAEIRSPQWTGYLLLRFAALSSVPLFLLLTGYLNRKKQLTGAYFRGLLPIVISYAVIAAASVCLTNWAGYTQLSLLQSIRAVLNFTAHDYGWYVEMYIGLYLLIPFLNLLFERLGSFRNRMILCGILCIMTNLPAALKGFWIGGMTLDILPDYWEAMYPLSYYYIGAMIGEYRPRLRKSVSVPLALLAVLIPSSLCWLFSSPETGYAWHIMNGFSCITTGAIAVAIFLILYDIELPGLPAILFR